MSGTPGDDVRTRFRDSTARHLVGALHEGLGRLFAHRIDGRQAAELRAAGLAVP